MSVPVVGLARDATVAYPSAAPFDPSAAYPELARLPGGAPPLAATDNPAFRLVRLALYRQGLDAGRFGTGDWNPFGALVRPDSRVVIKPNLVLESAPNRAFDGSIVTHASVIRPLVDYVRLAGGATTDILIGDVPLQGADFDIVVGENGLRTMVAALQARGDRTLHLLDLRRERAMVDRTGFITRIATLPGDPRGYVEVDVGRASRLEELGAAEFEGFAVSDYMVGQTQAAHARSTHRYLMPASVLQADLFINVPKLKTHQKAGLTVAIKNLVGINGDKSRVPHFRLGGPRYGGDEYPPGADTLRALKARVTRALQGRSQVLYRAARRAWRVSRAALIPRHSAESAAGATTLVSGGAWHGNDTLWRALHDLNLALQFADASGRLQPTAQRNYLCVVDGIVAGEGDGPLRPEARHEGVIMVGTDPLAVDLVAARYMGLDWKRIPQTSRAIAAAPRWSAVRRPLEEGGVIVAADADAWPAEPPFRLAPGWVGHAELAPRS